MDQAVLALLEAWRSPPLTTGFAALTWLGSLFVLLPLAAWLGWRQQAAGLCRTFLALAVGGSALLAHGLKLAIDRPRPDLFPALIEMPVDPSFPSAHSMQITAFVAGWLLCTGKQRDPGWLAIGLLVVLLVGLSRLYLQVHYPSDVLFGVLFGLAWVWALHALTGGRRSA